MDSWKDKLGDLWGAIDVDVKIRSKNGDINATSSGATGRPGVAFDFGSLSGRIGDYQVPPVVFIAAAAFVVFKVLK